MSDNKGKCFQNKLYCNRSMLKPVMATHIQPFFIFFKTLLKPVELSSFDKVFFLHFLSINLHKVCCVTNFLRCLMKDPYNNSFFTIPHSAIYQQDGNEKGFFVNLSFARKFFLQGQILNRRLLLR